MKLIQIVGRSNSGKTTFIKDLIPALKKRGNVAVIKHLGDHEYILEKEKDTTGFFDAGADISVGIDADKAIVALRTNALDKMLHLLADQNMDFVVIEGFKQRSFPKIVIGDLEVEGCILTNPTINNVIASLDLFENY